MLCMKRITAKQLKLGRTLLEKSASEFGKMVGVSKTTIHRMESCSGEVTGDIDVISSVQNKLEEYMNDIGWELLPNGGLAPISKPSE